MTIYWCATARPNGNRARRYQGWSDSPLTERGVAQATALGRKLATLPEVAVAEIVASPIGRARRTAEIIAECLGYRSALRFDDRLREISLGSWDGMDRRQIVAQAPELFAPADGRWEWYFGTPDGETYEGFAGRIAAWLGELGDAPIIAVSHGIVTRVLRGLYAGLPRAESAEPCGAAGPHLPAGGGTIEEIAA